MKLNKKGQITYFVIAGIVILIIAAFIIYLRGTVVEKETEKEVERVKVQAFSTQQVENYVTDCLRITAENALDLLGRQGGVIYMIDNGEIMQPEPADEGINFIKHGTCSDISSNSDCYIWNIVNLVGPLLDKGHHNLLDLYRNPPGSTHSVYGAMDESIRRYIEQDPNFETCFINNGIPNLIKQGFEIDYSGAQRKVKFTVTENDVAVNLNYPLKITDKATGKIENIENFKANLNVRLNRIWDFVNDIINNDLRNPGYDIRQSDDGITSSFGTVESAPNGRKVQLIEVTDTKSKLKGEDYKFVFGRANRAPAITPIGDQSVNEGQTLTLTISAADYDEGTSLTYSAPILPVGASFAGNIFTWTPGFGQAGPHTAKFSVSDGDTTSYEEITITVNKVNRDVSLDTDPIPSLVPPGIVTILVNDITTLSVSATDEDGDATYSLSIITDPRTPPPTNLDLFRIDANGEITISPIPGDEGAYEIEIVIEDSSSSDSERVDIQINLVCSDPASTSINTCSTTKPKYCDALGNLQDDYCFGPDGTAGNADDCGCSGTKTCQSDGTCAT